MVMNLIDAEKRALMDYSINQTYFSLSKRVSNTA